jgi:hypothetical protein
VWSDLICVLMLNFCALFLKKGYVFSEKMFHKKDVPFSVEVFFDWSNSTLNTDPLSQKMEAFLSNIFSEKNIIFLEEQSTKAQHQNTNQFRSLSSNQLQG